MIKSRITLKQLEALVQVVDQGTFRKAALALGTTQPNVSARIASLETVLDVVLMHRDAGSVRLTATGAELVTAARAVIRSGEAFLEVADRRDLMEDRLRLGVTELVACTWLHDFLRRFRAVYPSVKVALQVDLAHEIDRQMAVGALDLVLQSGAKPDQSAACTPIGTAPYAWLAIPKTAETIGRSPRMATVFDQSILTHARHTQAVQELEAFADAGGFDKGQIVNSSSLASCLPMAMDGMGVALLPKPLVQDAVAAGTLVELSCDWTPSALETYSRFDPDRSARFVAKASALAAQAAARFDDQQN
ncbi:LysR family transcriptional regulator [Sulfitobacter aestuariivivens]|uniref:LysR family transcriptional regulator n=1 Tax=Sulfitobacter aestuariivivens TaxID=2766981 RepID=A0A927D9I1_9RHOB|nr:LysR family transcriptional regulator [Sulfitobacter aestuariivivens]MBD3666122.1 LysR family transcriptional regulator [Sulfitobacter aestuariivivens]